MQTALDLVLVAAERTPRAPAIVDPGGRSLTYAEVVGEVDAMAAGLAERGIGPGTRAATALPNRLEHCIALLALQRAGAVTVVMSPRLKPPELASLMRRDGAAAAIVPAGEEVAHAAAQALPDRAPLLTAGGPTAVSEDLAACAGDPGSLPPAPRPDGEDAAFIFYTSGTTGVPKAALIPHRASQARVVWMATQGEMDWGPHNRVLGLMPLAHVVGFYAVFLTALAFNGRYLLVPAFDPARAVDLIEREEVTAVFASPTHFYGLAETAEGAPERLRSIKSLLYAGAPMDRSLQRRVNALFPVPLRNIYGTTETMNALHQEDVERKPNALRPGYGARVRVAPFDRTAVDGVAAEEHGELLVGMQGDAAFLGYLDERATAEKVVDGWYRTGDVASVDGDGEIVIHGRVDDLIRSGAESVSPAEVEDALATAPGVADVAVVGCPDARWGQVVVGCVVVRDAAERDAAAIDRHVREQSLAPFKRPRAYLFVEEIPRNAAFKVLRNDLAAQVEAALEGDEPPAFQRVGDFRFARPSERGPG